MKTLVIGANGQVGKHVIEQLKETAHHSVAMIRNESQINELRLIGANEVVVGDLEADFSHAFENVDTVIFTAGSGGHTGADKTIVVDLWGAIKAIQYAEQYKIKQFILLSATHSAKPDVDTDGIKPYAIAKHVADYYLKQSSLTYTTIHPGPMSNDTPTGKIDASLALNFHPSDYLITRQDVANVLIQSIENEHVKNKAIFIKNGEFLINDALSSQL